MDLFKNISETSNSLKKNFWIIFAVYTCHCQGCITYTETPKLHERFFCVYVYFPSSNTVRGVWERGMLEYLFIAASNIFLLAIPPPSFRDQNEKFSFRWITPPINLTHLIPETLWGFEILPVCWSNSVSSWL